jgi:drug/metabolite transporter (DMT)-like permease
MWDRGVAAIGPARAGAYLYLIPLMGALMAVLFLGESIRAYHAVGLVLIVGGVWLATRRR